MEMNLIDVPHTIFVLKLPIKKKLNKNNDKKYWDKPDLFLWSFSFVIHMNTSP